MLPLLVQFKHACSNNIPISVTASVATRCNMIYSKILISQDAKTVETTMLFSCKDSDTILLVIVEVLLFQIGRHVLLFVIVFNFYYL